MRLVSLDRLIVRAREQHQRHRTRRQLLTLEDPLLRDIGLSRADAEREGIKPFWKS